MGAAHLLGRILRGLNVRVSFSFRSGFCSASMLVASPGCRVLVSSGGVASSSAVSSAALLLFACTGSATFCYRAVQQRCTPSHQSTVPIT